MKTLQTRELPIREIPPFGNIDLGITVNRFFMAGFRPGDAVDVVFSNGFTFRNIPVFSGFYGRGDMPCLYAASSLYPHAGVGCPVSGSPWAMAGVKSGDTARVFLRRRRGFDRMEKRMRLPALLNPSHTRTPQQNANWRSLAFGGNALGVLYRSCSPIRNDSVAPAIACTLMDEAGVRSVLNLSDSPALMQACAANTGVEAAAYLRLCDEDRVLPLHLGVDFRLRENASSLAHGLLWLAGQPKPALIHCKLGLDRTGVVCTLLEMLAGCGYDDIRRDYEASYFNLFGHPKGRQGYPLCDVRFKELMDYLLSLPQGAGSREDDPAALGAEAGQSDVPGVPWNRPDGETLHRAARAYLAFGGLDEEQIDSIERMLEEVETTSEEESR